MLYINLILTSDLEPKITEVKNFFKYLFLFIMEDFIQYEKIQNLNFITKFLHSYRYSWILSIFKNLLEEVDNNQITVVDVGCGTCKLFKILSESSLSINYIGIEPNDEFVETAIQRYDKWKNFQIIRGRAEEVIPNINQKIDIFTALESFEHIPEYIVPILLRDISAKQPKVFACSVPVEVGPAIWIKNIGSKLMGYERYKEYKWSETFWAGLYQLDRVEPHGIGHKGFDWRWLKHNIRQTMKITSVRKSPFSFVPASLAPSICFTSEPLKNINN